MAKSIRISQEVWGRDADKIAENLGAKKINPNANEYKLNDQALTIRCARSTTNPIGVTYKMLERIRSVIAALENDAGQFDLYAITPEQYSEEMRGTRSKGPSSGRVGMGGVSPYVLAESSGRAFNTIWRHADGNLDPDELFFALKQQVEDGRPG